MRMHSHGIDEGDIRTSMIVGADADAVAHKCNLCAGDVRIEQRGERSGRRVFNRRLSRGIDGETIGIDVMNPDTSRVCVRNSNGEVVFASELAGARGFIG